MITQPVSSALHRVCSATMVGISQVSNPRKINVRLIGHLRAFSLALLPQQEVTNHDPYQPVPYRDSSHHPGNH